MPDITNILKSEITRLCRKELKKDTSPLRKLVTDQRRDLAALKKELAAAGKRIAVLERAGARSAPAPKAEGGGKSIRFVAKGLRSMRTKLGLSAGGLAALLGVSEQSLYNWESKKTVPRRNQVEAISALRGIGKREARARLEQLAEKE